MQAAVPVAAYGSARLLAGVGAGRRVDLETHRRLHGPQHHRTQQALATEADQVALLGRGGAAFPVSAKLRAVPARRSTQIVVNGSESEPASRKDRTLLTLAPHLVLDGAVVVARALRTKHITVAVHDLEAWASLRDAVIERAGAEPGPERIDVRHQPAGFVSGEVRALLRGLDGFPAVPPGRRTLPTVSGLGGAPTFAGNVETFAQIALLVSLGIRTYAEVGHAHDPGTTLLTLVGDVRTPGIVEVPTGLPLRALLPHADAPVLIGGYHGRWVAHVDDLVVSRTALKAAGVPMNAGVVACLPSSACALAEVAAVTGWLAAQSAGQCGPCLYGTDAVARDVFDLYDGRSSPGLAVRLAGLVGRGACAHPDGTAAFVGSALDVMREEIDVHRRRGACGRPYAAVLPLEDRLR